MTNKTPSAGAGDGRPTTTVWSVATQDYERFVWPFVASALACWPSAFIEVGVEHISLDRFVKHPNHEILSTQFGQRFEIRAISFKQSVGIVNIPTAPNSVRFLVQPNHQSSYVYISDIDYVVTRPDLFSRHLTRMKRSGLPYSNMVRPGRPGSYARLSGLHFAEWDSMYPLANLDEEGLYGLYAYDEALLFAMVNRRRLGFDFRSTFRPEPGLHMSPNRPAGHPSEAHLRKLSSFMKIPAFALVAQSFESSINPYLSQFFRSRSGMQRAMQAV